MSTIQTGLNISVEINLWNYIIEFLECNTKIKITNDGISEKEFLGSKVAKFCPDKLGFPKWATDKKDKNEFWLY